VRKAEAALIAAIEVYNRPTFAYREETFAILALNAWELLFKAKLLALNNNKTRCLWALEHKPTKKGPPSKKLTVKLNRSGTPMTHSLSKVITEIEKSPTKIDTAVKTILEALTEIRDNAVHFVIASPQLSKQVLGVGTAAVRNFVELAREWFEHDMSGQHFFLMPIGFVDPPAGATAVPLTPDQTKLISFLNQLANSAQQGSPSPFNIAVDVNLSFKRSTTPGAMKMVITDDPTAPKMQIAEANIKKIYKWTYEQLIGQLRRRYSDFSANAKFHQIRKPLMSDPKFVHSRLFDPDNPKSGHKDFYAPEIISEFNKHYTRKPSATP
jgi:hypothetical protein